MFVNLKNNFKKINYDKLFTVIVIIGIFTYIIFNNIPFFIERFVIGNQSMSYTKTQYVLLKCNDYLNDYQDIYPKVENNTYCITLGELRYNGYINGSIKYPNTLEELDDTYTIKALYINGKYDLQFDNYCTSIIK